MPLNTRQQHRLMSRVRVHDGCWDWVGSISPQGYAVYSHGGRTTRAALWVRIALGLAVPRRNIGEVLTNTCHNKRCVNPGHNVPAQRPSRAAKEAATCDRGHNLAETLRYGADGHGFCSVCRTERERERRAAKRVSQERSEFEAWARKLHQTQVG